MVPQLSGAVITFDNSDSPKPLCDGAGAPFPCRDGNIFGGKTPAETWYGAMKPLLDGQPVQPLPPTDPRYTEGGAETRSRTWSAGGERRPRHPRTRRLEGLHATSTTAPRGHVVGQNPNSTALPGETILLQISTGQVPPAPSPPGSPSSGG